MLNRLMQSSSVQELVFPHQPVLFIQENALKKHFHDFAEKYHFNDIATLAEVLSLTTRWKNIGHTGAAISGSTAIRTCQAGLS